MPTSSRAEQLGGLNRNPSQLINWFDDFLDGPRGANEFKFLSNFYQGGEPIPMTQEYYALLAPRVMRELDGQVGTLHFDTGEHMYQAAKAVSPDDFERVVLAVGPGQSKARGRSITMHKDWEATKWDVMTATLRSKFHFNRAEAVLLLRTDDAYLMEGTFWGDQIWGVELDQEGWPGKNWLGVALMAQRAALRQIGNAELDAKVW